MPFDGTNFTRAKPDVFSVEGLRDWLMTQPLGQEYDYMDCRGKCLIDQYLWAKGEGQRLGYVKAYLVCHVLQDEIACVKPWTFGAALSRCDAYLATRRR